MPAQIIDCRAIAAQIRAELLEEATRLRAAGIVPGLRVVLVGDDAASHIYIRHKKQAAEELGIIARDHVLPAGISQSDLLGLIRVLNADASVHGILIQTPLPAGLDHRRILSSVDPAKDVDGLHPRNLGELLIDSPLMPPCTPAGVMELLRRTGVPLAGREAVVVGRSQLVGKPAALLLLRENATVTLCHSRTRDLPAVCRRADILVVATGRARMIIGEYVSPGAVVVDVGISRVDGRVVGDVDRASVEPVAGMLTPVPGGVGVMTVTMLMKNTLIAARSHAGR